MFIVKKIILFILLISFFITFNPTNTSASGRAQTGNETLTPPARVIEILEESSGEYSSNGVRYEYQVARVKILSGPFKDQELVAINENYHLSNANDDYSLAWVKENDKVIVQVGVFNGEIIHAEIMTHTRDLPTAFLLFIFIGLLLYYGKKQGFKAVVSIGITLILIFKFMIPYLFQGYNPIFLAIITGTIVTVVTFLLVSGLSKKMLAATIGTVGGLAAAAFISIIFSKAMRLSGYHSDDERILLSISNEISFDFQGLLLAGIIIGALGAIMDVAISIASSMEEVRKSNPRIKNVEIFKSGMNVGKDIMGTMANTLILAYVGAGLPLLITLYGYESTFSQMIHMEFLAVEILRTAAGSIGLILSIPITAFVASLLLKENRRY